MEDGWASDTYYYYTDSSLSELLFGNWGRGGLIWDGVVESGCDVNGRRWHKAFFFVGTEEQYQRYGFTVGDRKVGPID
jgi:hypothetical protein